MYRVRVALIFNLSRWSGCECRSCTIFTA